MTAMPGRSQRVVQRDLSETNLKRAKADLAFLPRLLDSFHGELDAELRGNRIHIYHRGNRAVEVLFASAGMYTISMHERFVPERLTAYLSENQLTWNKPEKGKYPVCKSIPAHLLHPVLQKTHLQAVCSKIKKVGYSEELHFEQMVITDNQEAKCFVIDRQVSGTGLQKQSMDLLALERIPTGDYRFLVLELKMGNNPELSGEVAGQLGTYTDHISDNIRDYQACYEEVYSQKMTLGLLGDISGAPESVTIVDDVHGAVVVAGYSGLAAPAIDTLMPKLPQGVRFYQYSYGLDEKHRLR